MSSEHIPDRLPRKTSRFDSSLEGKALRETVIIGGRTAQELLGEFVQNGIGVDSYARSMMESPAFTTSPKHQQIETIRLQIIDLAIPKDYPTTDEIYGRIDELGLEPLSAEAALYYFFQTWDQLQQGEVLFAGMKPIADSDGSPSVFILERDYDELWLDGNWAWPVSGWNPEAKFVFGLRK